MNTTSARQTGIVTVLIISLVTALGGLFLSTAAAAGSVTFTATQTIPVPPASAYQGSGGGDGWAVALNATQVFNVFHHSPALTVACHLQSDASPCWTPRTIVDSAGGGFATSGHTGLWMDRSGNKLYVYATRSSDATAGVVCVDPVVAATSALAFCGFTALTSAGAAPLANGFSALSEPALVGSKWYAFDYVDGGPASASGANRLLCFDTTTRTACAAQPFAVDLGLGVISANNYPSGQVAGIGTRVIVASAMEDGGTQQRLGCFDAATGSECSGTWPVNPGSTYASSFGAPFAMLDAAGTPTGFCLPTGSDPCFTLSGGSAPTPAALPGSVSSSSGWNGSAAIIGARVYVPNGNADRVECFNWATASGCANFPKSFANLNLLYSVNPDPARPACLWVNADGGSGQIQNFDAYSGTACGQGPIRVLASSFVVATSLCRPATYTSLQVTSPGRSGYETGTVSFQDGDANAISGLGDATLDAIGAVDLSANNLSTAKGLPQFLITLTKPAQPIGEVSVKLTWTGTDDPSCIKPGTTTSNGDSAGQCGDTVFIAATGSGQPYTSPSSLDPSPELKRAYKGMQSTAGSKKIGIRVINYPATSVDALLAGLDGVTGNAVTYPLNLRTKLAANIDGYLAGQDAGVAQMWGAYTSVRFNCPRGTRIVLGGYSQGAMVVHEFLYDLAQTNDKAGKKAIIGIVLIADPERVKHSAAREMGSVADNSYGICDAVRALVDCTYPYPLQDIPSEFRHETVSVCDYYDVVCDTSTIAADLASFWWSTDTRNSMINLAQIVHTPSYGYSPMTLKAGERIGRRIAAK